MPGHVQSFRLLAANKEDPALGETIRPAGEGCLSLEYETSGGPGSVSCAVA